MPFTPPAHQVSAYNCPLCAAYSAQIWMSVSGQAQGRQPQPLAHLEAAMCFHCGRYTLWFQGRLIFPDAETAALPNQDLPPDVLADYEEARSILSKSPRSAAALLRLAIQKLCAELGEPGKNINDVGLNRFAVGSGINEKVAGRRRHLR